MWAINTFYSGEVMTLKAHFFFGDVSTSFGGNGHLGLWGTWFHVSLGCHMHPLGPYLYPWQVQSLPHRHEVLGERVP